MFHFEGPPPKKFPLAVVKAAREALNREPHVEMAAARVLDIPGYDHRDSAVLDWIMGQRIPVLARN